MNNRLKTIKLLSFFVLILQISFVSCNDTEDKIVDSNIENEMTKVENETTLVQARVISSDKNIRITEIIVTNKITKEILPSIFHKLILTDNNADINEIKDFNNLNAIVTVGFKNKLLFETKVLNGKINTKKVSKDYNLLLKEYPCTAAGLVECADDSFNDMNFVQYAFCLASAPACLAREYLSCAWDNC
mgnify:CR=1 FL=1